MRTSKNVQACLGEEKSSISLLRYGLEQASLSPLSLLMDTMQISCWRKKNRIEPKREVE